MSAFDGAVAREASRRWEGIAPLLSGLCFVHCVGLAALAPILPGALGLLTSATWLEPCLFAVSVVASGATLRRARAPGWTFVLWGLNAGMGLWGMAREIDLLTQISLGAIVVLQVVIAVRRWRGHRAACLDCRVCTDERSGT